MAIVTWVQVLGGLASSISHNYTQHEHQSRHSWLKVRFSRKQPSKAPLVYFHQAAVSVLLPHCQYDCNSARSPVLSRHGFTGSSNAGTPATAAPSRPVAASGLPAT